MENTLVLANTRKRTHSKNEAGHRALIRELRNSERTVQTTKFTQTGCLTSIKGRVCTGTNIATPLHTTRNTKVVATINRQRSLFPTEKKFHMNSMGPAPQKRVSLRNENNNERPTEDPTTSIKSQQPYLTNTNHTFVIFRE